MIGFLMIVMVVVLLLVWVRHQNRMFQELQNPKSIREYLQHRYKIDQQ